TKNEIMSPQTALHDPVFRAYLWIVPFSLIAGGALLALLKWGLKKEISSMWRTYCSWLIMAPLALVVVFAGRIPTILGVTLLAIFGFKEFARASFAVGCALIIALKLSDSKIYMITVPLSWLRTIPVIWTHFVSLPPCHCASYIEHFRPPPRTIFLKACRVSGLPPLSLTLCLLRVRSTFGRAFPFAANFFRIPEIFC